MPFAWRLAWAGGVALFIVPLTGHTIETAGELAQKAVDANPALEDLEVQKLALEQRVQASRVWKDPVLSVEYSNFPWNTWSLGDSPMTGVQFKIQQTLPFPGKNARRQEAARARAELVEIQKAELANALRASVKRSYYELALVRQLENVTRQHVEAVDGLRERVRLVYEVGRGNQKDVLQLDLLKAKLRDRLGDFGRSETQLLAAINAALHRDLDTPIPTPDDLPLITPTVSADDLLKRAVNERPALRAKRKQADIHRLTAEQEDYERLPDVSVWLGYRIRVEAGMDSGVDQMSIGASVPLPFDFTGRSESLVRGERLLADAARFGSEALRDTIAEGIHRELARWRRSATQARNYRETLIPTARETQNAALLAYETDRADFWSVYRAEVDLVELEGIFRSAAAEAFIARTRIEELIGADLGAAAVRIEEPEPNLGESRTQS